MKALKSFFQHHLNALHCFEHRLWANRTIQADHVGAPFIKFGNKVFGGGSVKGASFFVDRH